MRIRDCIKDETWDVNTISRLVPNNMLNHIIHIPIGNRQINDTPVWTETSNRSFTCSSAFNCIRKRRDMDNIWKDVWKKNVQFKMSFFLWRAIKGKLPVDETLKRFGHNIISRCSCCLHPKKETISHILFNSDSAFLTWNFFADPLGIKVGCQSIAYYFKRMEEPQNKNDVQRDLCRVVPIFICWDLWKHRCSIRYGNINPTIAKLRQSILFRVKVYMKKRGAIVDMKWQWHQICTYMEDYRPRITSTPVI